MEGKVDDAIELQPMDGDHTGLIPILAEGIEPVRQLLDDLGNKIPELNYWGFSFYTYILPEILKKIALVLPQPGILGPIWNYADAGAGILVGLSQLTDTQSHRQIATKTKGVLNISSSIMLITVTAINFSLMGGPGFAAAFGMAFVMSLDETARAVKRHVNKEYYVEDNLKQLKSIHNRVELLKIKIPAIQIHPIDKEKNRIKYKLKEWSLKSMNDELRELQEKQKKMEQDTLVQYLRLRMEEEDKNKLMVDFDYEKSKQEKRYDSYTQLYGVEFCAKLKALDSALDDYTDFNKINNIIGTINHIKDKKGNPIVERISSSDELNKYVQHLETENKQAIKDNLKNNISLGLAFVGMLLICFPVTHLIGLIFIGAASAIYFATHSTQIKEKFADIIEKIIIFVGRKMESRKKNENESSKEEENGNVENENLSQNDSNENKIQSSF